MKSRDCGILLAFLSACGPASGDADGSGSTGGGGESASATASATDGHATTSATGSESADTSTPGDTSLDSGSTGNGCPPPEEDPPHLDIGGAPPECDIFLQDCPEGEKCVPEFFSTRVCVPIAVEPIPTGDPCAPQADADPCEADAWCLADPSADTGTCVVQCAGDASDPVCPPDMICVIDDENVVAYCAPPCDPFAEECDPMTCKPTPHGFGCVPSGMRHDGESCSEDDSCGTGLACRVRPPMLECCSGRCCASYCDDAHPCTTGACIPFDPPLPGADGVGMCG
ncbi:MAG TPA: hypothetical protein VFG69_02100 [Nannocystaceae bacterium]|nr:hypothetical protein [Nannocystaceae bacterium]